MTSDNIRIGFVGAGANTTLRHIPGFEANEGVELVSVANRSRASGQRISDGYNIPTVYDGWADLIGADDTNAICIGTWPYMHRTLVEAALDANKHVMTEARMTMSAADAHAMLAASRSKPGLITQIVPAPHTLSLDKTIISMINDGYVGDVLSVDMTVHQGGFVDGSGPHHWRHSRDLSGHNIMQMGIWYEAMMRWIGPAAKVHAVGRINVKSRFDADGNKLFITIPDHVEIIAEMYSGPVVRMRVSTVTGHAPADAVWIYGSEGTLHIDSPSMTLSGGRRSDDGMKQIEISDANRGAWRVEDEFINAIRGTEVITHTSFEDGVRYMEFSEAVNRSIQTGKAVNLPL